MTFTTVFQYDSWNRVKKIAYPDGEVVSYSYNKGGLLKSMRSMKSTQTYKYVNDVQYDKFEKRIFLWGGNGTKTEYQYNTISQKLSALIATDSSGTEMMDKSFSYDNTDNIDTIIDNASKHVIGSDTIGGASVYHFVYDSLYRLLTANGSCGNKASIDTYSLGMTYSGSGKIMEKNQAHAHNNNPVSTTSYSNTYTYSTSQPHAAVQIGNMNYNYDANGNMTQSTHIYTAAVKHLRWDEENRLKMFCDHEQVGAYLYDAGGERYLKIQGTQVSQDINGTQGINGYAEDGQTLYVNPFMAVNDKIYTKHFYIEGERIATKIGAGMNISGSTVNAPSTPSSRKWYRPFIGFHADSTLTGFDLLTMADYNDKMLSIDSMLNRDLDSIGEGPFLSFTGRIDSVVSLQLTQNSAENQLYFYHPDHLGSSTYVSDLNGLPTQRLEYFPFGEVLVGENRSTFDIPYKFSAKELDEESGLVYYGARYYDPKTSIFHGVDPKADKYPGWSVYAYCMDNPIRLIDPDGMEAEDSEILNHGPKSDNKNGNQLKDSNKHTPESKIGGGGDEKNGKNQQSSVSMGAALVLAAGTLAPEWTAAAIDPEPVSKVVAAVVLGIITGYVAFEIYQFGKASSKNERKINSKAQESAEGKVKSWENKLQQAKTKAEKAEAQRQIDHWRLKAKQKSEPHGRNSPRH